MTTNEKGNETMTIPRTIIVDGREKIVIDALSHGPGEVPHAYVLRSAVPNLYGQTSGVERSGDGWYHFAPDMERFRFPATVEGI